MAERLTSSVQTSWPFVVAVVLWRHAARTRRPGRPGGPPEASHAQAMTAETITAEATTTEATTTEAMTAEAMTAEAMTTGAMTTGALRGQRDLA